MTEIEEGRVPIEHDETVQRILRSNEWFMSVLHAARVVDLPDWYVGAGVIRNIVWDYLHSYAVPTPLADVDVVFFDPQDLTPGRDAAAEAHLRAQMPHIPWQAKNQAAVHLWYPRVFGYAVEPLRSSEDAISTWPETATCVGVRLLPDDTLSIAAPCGLADLLQMALRRNPRRVSVELFNQRLQSKRIREKWPRVKVIDG